MEEKITMAMVTPVTTQSANDYQRFTTLINNMLDVETCGSKSQPASAPFIAKLFAAVFGDRQLINPFSHLELFTWASCHINGYAYARLCPRMEQGKKPAT